MKVLALILFFVCAVTAVVANCIDQNYINCMTFHEDPLWCKQYHDTFLPSDCKNSTDMLYPLENFFKFLICVSTCWVVYYIYKKCYDISTRVALVRY